MAADESVRSEVGRIAPVEGLRGIAVLWVIVFHCSVLRPNDPWVLAIKASPLEPLVRNGYLGVDLFFLISGFLLAMPWFVHSDAGRDSPSMKSFYARRFWRIAPAYYVQLAFLFLVAIPALRGYDYWRHDKWVFLYNFFAHVTFLHNTTPLSSGSMAVNGALWTLSVEAQFYVLLPLVIPLFVRRPWFAFAVSIVAAQLWRIGARDGLVPLVQAELAFGSIWSWPEGVVRYLMAHQLPSYFGHFGAGILLGRMWLWWRDSLRGAWWIDAVLAAAFVLLYYALAVDGEMLGDMSWSIHLVSLAALMFWAVMRPGKLAMNLLGRGPLASAGRISYSAYLYHLPLLLIANEYLADAPAWAVIPVYLVATFAVSWLSWKYVEQPFLRRYVREREPTARAVPIANT
ncbi:MAG TPA: acyltransferase [Usitatibacter sp.]|nr:acyltransferase [Usitatibacter sp.]